MIRGGSGLIALLHRLGLDYHKPNVIPRKLDEEKQKAFIASYEKLLSASNQDYLQLFGGNLLGLYPGWQARTPFLQTNPRV